MDKSVFYVRYVAEFVEVEVKPVVVFGYVVDKLLGNCTCGDFAAIDSRPQKVLLHLLVLPFKHGYRHNAAVVSGNERVPSGANVVEIPRISKQRAIRRLRHGAVPSLAVNVLVFYKHYFGIHRDWFWLQR